MKELQKLVTEQIQVMNDNGKIQDMVNKQIGKTIESLLEEVLRPYSEFGKKLREYLQTVVNVNFTHLGFEGYNDFILKVLKKKYDERLADQEINIGTALTEILITPPKEVKLSELVEALKQDNISSHQYGDHCTCIVETDAHNYSRIYLHDDESKDKRSCNYTIAIDANGNAYDVSIRGYQLKKQLFTGPYFGFERLLFQLYATNAKLILDEDDLSTEYNFE